MHESLKMEARDKEAGRKGSKTIQREFRMKQHVPYQGSQILQVLLRATVAGAREVRSKAHSRHARQYISSVHPGACRAPQVCCRVCASHQRALAAKRPALLKRPPVPLLHTHTPLCIMRFREHLPG